MSHLDYKEALPLYSLGVLEEAEKRALKEHLSTCADCCSELDAWRDTSAALAYAAKPAEPAPELRIRILASVSSMKVSEAAKSEAAARSQKATDLPTKAASSDSNVVHLPVRSWNLTKTVLAIAASLAFVALIASLFVVWSRNRAMQSEIASLSNGLDQAQNKLARLEQDTEILNAPTLAIATFKGTAIAAKAQGKLMYDQKTGQAIFTASDLPPVPSGKTYQLWYLVGNRALPGGVFGIDSSGRATMRDQLSAEARAAKAFAVTLEPASGASAPTGGKYLISPAL